jgi:hypothetical protein
VYKGANQYRTRFLRAKRVDDEGRLSGTPTENSQHTAVDDTDDDAESENEDESHDHDGDRHDNQMSEKQTEDNEELTGDE